MFVFFCCAARLLYAIIDKNMVGRIRIMCVTKDDRELAKKRLIDEPGEEHLWAAIEAFSGFPFSTAKGLEFTYAVKGNEIFFSRKEKSVTRSTVNMAFHRAQELGVVTGPKKLGVFGASYIYPVFIEIGVIRSTGREDR